jgi:hypothetical protein
MNVSVKWLAFEINILNLLENILGTETGGTGEFVDTFLKQAETGSIITAKPSESIKPMQ